MSFFDDVIEDVEKNDGVFCHNFDLIPQDTEVKAKIIEAKRLVNYDNMDTEGYYISLQWQIMEGEYRGRVIFQKLYVAHSKENKKKLARTMLAAIDRNCYSYIAKDKTFDVKNSNVDSVLTKALVDYSMYIKIGVWKIKSNDGSEKTGNWVCGVSKHEPSPF